MKRENERLIIDGNAIYELDLECVRKKEQEKKKGGSRNLTKDSRRPEEKPDNNYKQLHKSTRDRGEIPTVPIF